MPPYLTAEEIEELNNDHARQIKSLMRGFLMKDTTMQPVRRPAEGEDSDEDDAAHRHGHGARAAAAMHIRNARPGHGPRCGELLALADDEQRKEIPMADIMKSNDAQHNAVLKKPWYVREESNRERVLAKFILDNVDKLLRKVPVRCKDFELLPHQRVAIIAMTNPMPVETYTSCEISRETMQEITGHRSRKQPFNITYSIDAGMLPVFLIADYCTGSGKTIMAIMAACSLLCNREGWTALKSGYTQLLRARTRETHSGLLKMDGIEDAKLARLAICFVPTNIISHWRNTAESAVFGVKEMFGAKTDVVVWVGLHRDHSVREAYESGKPIIWILAMEADSMKAIRQTPEIGYAVRIYDELNTKMKTRYDQPESTPLFNYITQATIESLERATEGNPRHPLRLAFGENYHPARLIKDHMASSNYKTVQTTLEHFCKMRQFAAPEFLRRLVADGVQSNMPSGLIVQRVNLRAGTLSAIATGSDMVRITFPELAIQLLGPGVAAHIKERVQGIFSRAEVANSAAILEELEQTYEGMPLLSMQDNHAKMAVKRLKDRMTDILGGTLPECPVTMEPIPKERVRILKCCTCVIDANVIDQCKGACPLCRAPIAQVGAIAEDEPLEELEPPKKVSDKAAGKRKVEPSWSGGKQQKLNVIPQPKRSESPSLAIKELLDSDDSDEEGPREESGDEVQEDAKEAEQRAKYQVFDDTIQAISAARPFSEDGIMRIMQAQVTLNPSSRMLLCFAFQDGQRGVVFQFLERIRREIVGSNVTDIHACFKNRVAMDQAKKHYDDATRFPSPQIFLLNTTANSTSVQGLDLYTTDLTIVADQCSLAIQRQAAGRSLRMRKRPKTMKKGDLFPAKRVVIAAIGGFGAPAANVPFNPDDGDVDSEEEIDPALLGNL